MAKILIAEDEPDIRELVAYNLGKERYRVVPVGTGEEALQALESHRPDLIVLDLMLPGIDGMQILKSIRLEDERLPILILSAKVEASDRVDGFLDGVDDYMTKPFSLEEFLLRIKRLLTRDQWQREQDDSPLSHSTEQRLYSFGANSIDFSSGQAECCTGIIQLTEQEIKVLKLFIVNKGKTLSRSKLLEIGWGYSKGTSTRTVDNYIVRFRRYFEDNPKNPKYFKSRRSLGYVFDHE
jgi:two-component system alkaline phosphatase synthesis response regulator PhoP